MTALFSKTSNWILWGAIGAFGAALVAAAVAPLLVVRTASAEGRGEPIVQPVHFDHELHVERVGAPCLYCHAGAAKSRWAGVPASSVCMHCHQQVLTDRDALAEVRASAAEDRPIAWERVTRLPDFVFFEHSVHVSRGVGCDVCHGHVERMSGAIQTAPLTMQWCLDCHRDPASHFAVGTDVHPRTDCTACHR